MADERHADVDDVNVPQELKDKVHDGAIDASKLGDEQRPGTEGVANKANQTTSFNPTGDKVNTE